MLLTNLDPNFIFLTSDTVSLYTNIVHKVGLRALIYYITKYRNVIPIRFSK